MMSHRQSRLRHLPLLPSTMADTRNGDGAPCNVDHDDPERNESLIRRSFQAIMSPFSQNALASLPKVRRPARHLRADNIPETSENEHGQLPAVRDYHSINS